MEAIKVIQGRSVSVQDLALIGSLLIGNPSWSRRRLSRELCHRWDSRNGTRQLKDMAARALLLKLERAGQIRLPPRRGGRPNQRGYRQVADLAHDRSPIKSDLRALRPLRLEPLGKADQILVASEYAVQESQPLRAGC